MSSLLPKIDSISSVSGGSLVAGFLAAQWRELSFDGGGVATNFRSAFIDKLVNFSQIMVDLPSSLCGLLKPFSSAARELQRAPISKTWSATLALAIFRADLGSFSARAISALARCSHSSGLPYAAQIQLP
jgi:hypothetical protein